MFSSTATHRLSLGNIAQSPKIIDPVFLNSPQYHSQGMSVHFGCELTLKIETANPVGCFKGRGASLFVQQAVSSGRKKPIVCASAGNFGQAMAYVCRSHGLPLTVFASFHANAFKIARMRSLGATLRIEGGDFDAAKIAARAWAEKHGALMVEDGRDPAISEGAGSIGVELLSRGDSFDAIFLPLGNGALLTGVARWIKSRAPATKILGVSSIHASAMHDSWKAGQIIEHAESNTIADGIAVRIPIPEALADMKAIVDDVYLVEDTSILSAMKMLLAEERLVCEPAGAAGIAALVEHRELRNYKRIATVVCGSNLTQEQVRTCLLC